MEGSGDEEIGRWGQFKCRVRISDCGLRNKTLGQNGKRLFLVGDEGKREIAGHGENGTRHAVRARKRKETKMERKEERDFWKKITYNDKLDFSERFLASF